MTINLFLDVKTRLIRLEEVFLTEGWHFEIQFDSDGSDTPCVMKIGGEDVDYLHLVGTVADKVILRDGS